MPDLLEFDGPFVYSYVWQKNLVTIDGLIGAKTRQDLLPSILQQGTYRGKLYSVGTFDSGLGLYRNLKQLKAAGIRIPKKSSEAWTALEFRQVLTALVQKDRDRQVLDLKLNYRGEWFTYGFSPILQSAGGDLINRKTYKTADGSLNSPAAVSALTELQGWIQKGYVDPNIDDAAFISGRVALSWVGHWAYKDYAKPWGRIWSCCPRALAPGRRPPTGPGTGESRLAASLLAVSNLP